MADLQSDVPQAIENGLGDQLAPCGLLVGQQEQQIDVGARRLQPAAIAAGGDDRHALGFGRVLRRVKMLAREFEQDADDFVFHPAEPFGAAPAVPVFEQQLLGLGAAVGQRRLEPLRHQGTQFALVAGVGLGELFELGGDRARVDQVARAAGGAFGGGRVPRSSASEAMGSIG